MGGKLFCKFASVNVTAPSLGWLADEAASLFEALPISVNVVTTSGIWFFCLPGRFTGRDRLWLFGY